MCITSIQFIYIAKSKADFSNIADLIRTKNVEFNNGQAKKSGKTVLRT